jgi:hypothetical protein
MKAKNNSDSYLPDEKVLNIQHLACRKYFDKNCKFACYNR